MIVHVVDLAAARALNIERRSHCNVTMNCPFRTAFCTAEIPLTVYVCSRMLRIRTVADRAGVFRIIPKRLTVPHLCDRNTTTVYRFPHDQPPFSNSLLYCNQLVKYTGPFGQGPLITRDAHRPNVHTPPCRKLKRAKWFDLIPTLNTTNMAV